MLQSVVSFTMSVLTTSQQADPPGGRHRLADEEDAFGRFSRSSSFTYARPPPADEWRGSTRLGGLINTMRLWNLVTPVLSYANLTLLFAASMTVCAQVLITWLPVFIGRATKELTGGSTGQFADLHALSTHLGLAFLCVFLYVSLRGGTQVLIMLMGLRWRYNLTRTLHSLYFSRKAYYRVNCLSELDNVDSRFASDLSTFIKLCCGGVSPPLTSTYVGIVGDVFLVITASFACFQRAGPRITAFAYIYNAVTILFAVFISIPIAKTTEVQEAREADYRHAQLRMKTYAEQVALLQGEELELHALDRRLDALVSNQRTLIFQYFRLALANTFSGVGGSLFGLAIASLTLLTRRLTFLKFDIEQLTTMLGTIEILSSACQALPTKLPMLNNIAGLSKRIIELFDALDKFASEENSEKADEVRGGDDVEAPPAASRPVVGSGAIALVTEYGGEELAESIFQLSVQGLHYSTPDAKRELARDLSFVVKEGMGVVIRGPSGCGKSSLIRCIAGLWTPDAGIIRRTSRCGRDGVVYMPQRPYMSTGSLRQQVLYPLIEDEVGVEEDESIAQLLVDFGLETILASWGLDGLAVWEDVLSAGEQQRLSFARVVYAQPSLVIMDEATSTLDLQNEALCMQRVLDEEISLLTIAHRPSVVRYHQLMLTMEMDGTFTPTPLVEMTPC